MLERLEAQHFTLSNVFFGRQRPIGQAFDTLEEQVRPHMESSSGKP